MGIKVVAPEGMVGDGVEVVQSTSVGGKGGVAYASEGGEDISSREARWVVLVGFISKGVMVIDTGVKSRVACGDAGVHGVQSLDGVAEGNDGGERMGRVRVAGGNEVDKG